MNNAKCASVDSKNQSQIDELLEAQCLHIEQLEDLVRRAADAFGPALHPELCGEGQPDGVPQPCRSPLGQRIYGYNDRLEQVCAGFKALISRSAL